MTINLPRTVGLLTVLTALLSRAAAATSAAFARAEHARHRRLGSAFLPPDRLRDLQAAALKASGTPILPPTERDQP
jgi:hypothetical protein